MTICGTKSDGSTKLEAGSPKVFAQKAQVHEYFAMRGAMARSSQLDETVMANARAKRGLQAGFTLAELLAVVAMIGILATIAMVSYRRYLSSSRVAEATTMVGNIRSAQEGYRSETMVYLNVSTEGAWYPAAPNDKKRAWDFPDHADYAKWRTLGVRSDGPVYFGYVTYAGLATEDVTAPTGTQATWSFDTPTEPWYIVQAAGDVNNDGKRCYVVGSSFTSEIYVENEGE